MAKKAKKRNSKIIWAKENKFKSLLAVLVFLFVALTLYNKVLAYQEKKEFEKARVAIEALYADIENLVGKPDKTDRISSCGYGSAKFTRGFRGCNVAVNFVYSIQNNDAAMNLVNSINAAVSQSHAFKLNYTDKDEVLPFNFINPRSTIKISQGYDLDTSLVGCSMSFHYGQKESIIKILKDNPLNSDKADLNLLIELGCGGDARAEHYPVKD